MTWTIAMFTIYAIGSLCFVTGSVIGILQQTGVIK